MIRVLLMAFGVLCVSSSAVAQVDGPESAGEILKRRCGHNAMAGMKLHGCLDWPPNGVTVSAGHQVIVFGWALNTETLQQPSEMTLHVLREPNAQGQRVLETLSPDDYVVYWRLPRPDVLAWARLVSAITSPNLGYAVLIKAGVLRPGPNQVAVMFTDSRALNPVGVNYQQWKFVVAP